MARTALFEEHVGLEAKLTQFAGYELPLQYQGILEEHSAVRNAAGIFDVSHMGKLLVEGRSAGALLDRLSTNLLKEIPQGRCVYTHFPDEEGRILDDAIVTRLGPEDYLVVPNASHRYTIREWIRERSQGERILDLTESHCCLALQGPKAEEILQPYIREPLSSLRPFQGSFLRIRENRLLGHVRELPPQTLDPLQDAAAWIGGGRYQGLSLGLLVTRTGYTGEDGFELFPPNALGRILWKVLREHGGPLGLKPAGLGARDLLRLEQGYLLSGQDFDGSQTSLQTGPAWVVKLDAHDFVGRLALLKQRAENTYTRLAAFRSTDRNIPRHGYPILHLGQPVGVVTSGTYSPLTKGGIALGYVPPGLLAPGTSLEVDVRGTSAAAEVTTLPFVPRGARR